MATSMVPRSLPWAQQPQGPALPSPELAISSLILPGINRLDIATNQFLPNSSGTLTEVVGQFGKHLSFSAAQSAIYTTATASQLNGEASIIWVGTLNATAPDSNAGLGGITYDNLNTVPYVCMELKRQLGAANTLFLNFGIAAAQYTVNSSANYSTGDVVIVGTARSGRQALFILSAAGVEVVTSAQAGTLASTATSRLEVGDSLNARNSQSSCAMQAMASRAWSDSEAIQLLYQPWLVFAPRRIWVPQAGITGLPILSASTYTPGSLASGGWRPRITAT